MSLFFSELKFVKYSVLLHWMDSLSLDRLQYLKSCFIGCIICTRGKVTCVYKIYTGQGIG